MTRKKKGGEGEGGGEGRGKKNRQKTIIPIRTLLLRQNRSTSLEGKMEEKRPEERGEGGEKEGKR